MLTFCVSVSRRRMMSSRRWRSFLRELSMGIFRRAAVGLPGSSCQRTSIPPLTSVSLRPSAASVSLSPEVSWTVAATGGVRPPVGVSKDSSFSGEACDGTGAPWRSPAGPTWFSTSTNWVKSMTPLLSVSNSTHSNFMSNVETRSRCMSTSHRFQVISPEAAWSSWRSNMKSYSKASFVNSPRMRDRRSVCDIDGFRPKACFSDFTNPTMQAGWSVRSSSMSPFGRTEQMQYVLAMTQLCRGWPVSSAISPK
mmetsp:Transcript_31241/g.88022  ORF Transcript_31241/g.88022 Transcript_31241/m.88022 type:complete len:252 (-) Transcript_31241:1009-1764(-)